MRTVLLLGMLCFSLLSFGQTVEMADEMRANGKIYVVVAVLSVILVGLITFLISIDRKVTKLEKSIKA